MRELFRRVDQQYYLLEYVHYLYRRVVHTISIVGVCPIDIHRRVVQIMSIVGVCLIDIHRRVVHKIDYRSVSTIYIRGCPRVNTNTFVWKWFSFMEKCMFEGVGEDLIHGA